MSSPGIGIFGGTFDPVHAGHIAVAADCRRQLGLDTVLLVPSARPPHRPAPVATAEDRLAMARLAVAGHEGLRVDDLEVRRGGVSYAAETVREMSRSWPREALVLLMGVDAAVEFGTWHQPDVIARLAQVCVFNRSGEGAPFARTLAAAGLPADTRILEVDSPAVSATAVRQGLAVQSNVAGMLAPAVLQYIRQQGLYGAA